MQLVEQNPGHSQWYIDRFRTMADEGADLHGEARFVDAMVARGAFVLDAGCGPGRVGGRLAALGHHVVGADIDPALIAEAQTQHPDATWRTADLAELDVMDLTDGCGFDAIVCAGNVLTFLDPSTNCAVLERLGAHLAPTGRLAVGFGAGRGYEFEQFFADVTTVGLTVQLRLSTWDLRPLEPSSDFLVAVLGR
jgi:2-polyprenyl-3-methyl-5-hydroxy-6-metoxy-1,4-benzoquinol methylase